MEKFLFIGLGNEGDEYQGTRHNIGFDVLDFFVQSKNQEFNDEKFGKCSQIKWKNRIIYCLKPNTYMNRSGIAMNYYLNKEKIELSKSLVIVDDLSLPIETLRVRKKGSSAGHNGLKSIEESLGTTEYPRLRFGIGNDFPKGQQVKFVLSKWKESEKQIISKKIKECTLIFEKLLFENFDKASEYSTTLKF